MSCESANVVIIRFFAWNALSFAFIFLYFMSDIHHDEFLGNSKQESSRLKKIPASTHASVTVWLSVHSELISLDSLFFTPVLERPNTWLRNVKLHDPSPISATTDNREGVTQYTGGCAFPDENQGVVGACHELTAGKTHLPTVSPSEALLEDGAGIPFPEETRQLPRTYWASPTRWSWSCRGPCPRCEHVESHFLSRLLEMILKSRVTTPHVIWLQATDLGLPIFSDLGCLLTSSPGFKYLKTGSGWKAKVTLLGAFYHFLGVHKEDFLLWILSFLPLLLLFLLLAMPSSHLCHSNLPHPSSSCNFENCDLSSWGPQGKNRLSISSALILVSLLHTGCPWKGFFNVQGAEHFLKTTNLWHWHSQSVLKNEACDYVLFGVVLLPFLPQLEMHSFRWRIVWCCSGPPAAAGHTTVCNGNYSYQDINDLLIGDQSSSITCLNWCWPLILSE